MEGNIEKDNKIPQRERSQQKDETTQMTVREFNTHHDATCNKELS
jgi:hypothetical protein